MMRKNILTIELIIVLLAVVFGCMGNTDFPCRRWNGEHQQLVFKTLNGRVYAECGSCGELIPVRSGYGKEAMLVKEIK